MPSDEGEREAHSKGGYEKLQKELEAELEAELEDQPEREHDKPDYMASAWGVILLLAGGVLVLGIVVCSIGDNCESDEPRQPRSNPWTIAYDNQASEPLDVSIRSSDGMGTFRMKANDGCSFFCPEMKCTHNPSEVYIAIWDIEGNFINDGTWNGVQCGEIYSLLVTQSGKMEFKRL